jgi:hypothetical protein
MNLLSATLKSAKPGRRSDLALASALLLGPVCLAHAAAVQFDGPNWHAIVIRPVDLWVGDAGFKEDALEAVRHGDVNYHALERGQGLRGAPLVLQGASDHPLVKRVADEVERGGMHLSRSQKYRFFVSDRQVLSADLYPAFAAAQARAYRYRVKAEGDPETLEARAKGTKILGGVLGLATIGLAGKLGGSTAALGLGQSSIPGEVNQIPLNVWKASVPVMLPALDVGSFGQVVVRTVEFKGGMNGQILIALRPGATDAEETDALVKSIAVAAGVGTSPAGIEQSRQEDLAQRRAVWKELQDAPANASASPAPASAASAAAAPSPAASAREPS